MCKSSCTCGFNEELLLGLTLLGAEYQPEWNSYLIRQHPRSISLAYLRDADRIYVYQHVSKGFDVGSTEDIISYVVKLMEGSNVS